MITIPARTAPNARDCVVVGAGPAGLSTAAMLGQHGIRALVVEQGVRLAPSWRARYDGFRLNTSSWFSYLPGLRFPRDAGRWPSRETIVDYYERYADLNSLRIQLGTEVRRVDRAPSGWALDTSHGRLDAQAVVIATGKYRTPVIPDWPGKQGFPGRVLHSSAYRNASPYRDRTALVVGAGNSGFEIANQLSTSGAARTWLSIRTPPHIIHRDIGPFPSDLFAVFGRRLPVALVDRFADLIRRAAIGDLSPYGLPPPPDGIYTRLRRTGMIPTIDGPFIDALRAGRLKVVAALDRFEGSRVVLADGSSLEPDEVIAATGYRRDLEPIVGHLGVLADEGQPTVHGPRTHPTAPGLYFIGFSEPLSGTLREFRFDARKIARAIVRERRDLPVRA